MIMLDSTHNAVDNLCLSGGRKVSLYTIMIRDPITGKGLPVCWAFTATAATGPIEAVLKWLRRSSGLIPGAIMSDCARAISQAVSQAYSDLGVWAPKHYWCLFHVLKAFKGCAIRYLDSRAEEAIKDFRAIVYNSSNPKVQVEKMCVKWMPVSRSFVKYSNIQWCRTIHQWATWFRTTPHQGIVTNNYTESWHRVLKTRYIPPPERRRLDEVVHVFVEAVLPDYQMVTYQVDTGIAKQKTNQFQRKSKDKGEAYTRTVTHLLGIHHCKFPDHYFISSFTSPATESYLVRYIDASSGSIGRLTSCTCQFFKRYGSACKHMYYLAKLHSLLVVENPIEFVREMPDDVRARARNPPNLVASQDGNDLSDSEEVNPLKRKRTCEDELPDLADLFPPQTRSISDLSENEIDGADPKRLQKLLLASAVKAIKQINTILKTIKNRRGFVLKVSFAVMLRYKETCDLLLKELAYHCPKFCRPEPAFFPGILVVGAMPTPEITKMIGEMQAAGWKAVLQAQTMLADVRNKNDLVHTASVRDMERLKALAYELLGLVEEGCPEVSVRTQVR